MQAALRAAWAAGEYWGVMFGSPVERGLEKPVAADAR